MEDRSPSPGRPLTTTDDVGKRAITRTPTAGDTERATRSRERRRVMDAQRRRMSKRRRGGKQVRGLAHSVRTEKKKEQSTQRRTNSRVVEMFQASLFDAFAWFIGIVKMAVGYLKRPLAYLLAVYLGFQCCIMAIGMLSDSLSSALSPLCNVPGVSWLSPTCATSISSSSPLCHLPGAQTLAPSWCLSPALKTTETTTAPPLISEIKDLIHVQEKTQKVLEKSVEMSSLPLELQRSDSVLRTLRLIIMHSDLYFRNELVETLSSLISTTGEISDGITRLYIRCDSLADMTITVNRYTMIKLARLEAQQNHGVPSLLLPILPQYLAKFLSNKNSVIEEYVRHISKVSTIVEQRADEAEKLLQKLEKGKDILAKMNEQARDESGLQKDKQPSSLQRLWILARRGRKSLHRETQDLFLLGQVESQLKASTEIAEATNLELNQIRSSLINLKERVRDTGVRDNPAAQLPLDVYISVIGKSVERLKRARHKALENIAEREEETRKRLKMNHLPFLDAK